MLIPIPVIQHLSSETVPDFVRHVWQFGPIDFINTSMDHPFNVEMRSLQWRHNGCDGVSNHQLHDWLLYRSFRLILENTSTLCDTGLCAENSQVTGSLHKGPVTRNIFPFDDVIMARRGIAYLIGAIINDISEVSPQVVASVVTKHNRAIVHHVRCNAQWYIVTIWNNNPTPNVKSLKGDFEKVRRKTPVRWPKGPEHVRTTSLESPFIQAQINENIKASRHRPFCGEFTGNRWIPRAKDQ